VRVEAAGVVPAVAAGVVEGEEVVVEAGEVVEAGAVYLKR
jgi:hypothetical protein